MSTKPVDGQMDYIEFPATDIVRTKEFYIKAFGWKFTDYGPHYTSFEDGRISGGFTKDRPVAHGALVADLFGDCYHTPLAEDESGLRPIMLYHHDGNGFELVCKSVDEFLNRIREGS